MSVSTRQTATRRVLRLAEFLRYLYWHSIIGLRQPSTHSVFACFNLAARLTVGYSTLNFVYFLCILDLLLYILLYTVCILCHMDSPHSNYPANTLGLNRILQFYN